MNDLLSVQGITKYFSNRCVSSRLMAADGCAVNGDYLTVRFNGMEDNVVLWTFNKGTRKFVKRGILNVPLAKNQWHTLQISVHGTNLQASLNGQHLLDYTLSEPVSAEWVFGRRLTA